MTRWFFPRRKQRRIFHHKVSGAKDVMHIKKDPNILYTHYLDASTTPSVDVVKDAPALGGYIDIHATSENQPAEEMLDWYSSKENINLRFFNLPSFSPETSRTIPDKGLRDLVHKEVEKQTGDLKSYIDFEIKRVINSYVDNLGYSPLSNVRSSGTNSYLMPKTKITDQEKTLMIKETIQGYLSDLPHLEKVSLNHTDEGYRIIVIHNFEDKGEALIAIEKRLIEIEKQFPDVSFEPWILHTSENKLHLQQSSENLIEK